MGSRAWPQRLEQLSSGRVGHPAHRHIGPNVVSLTRQEVRRAHGRAARTNPGTALTADSRAASVTRSAAADTGAAHSDCREPLAAAPDRADHLRSNPDFTRLEYTEALEAGAHEIAVVPVANSCKVRRPSHTRRFESHGQTSSSSGAATQGVRQRRWIWSLARSEPSTRACSLHDARGSPPFADRKRSVPYG